MGRFIQLGSGIVLASILLLGSNTLATDGKGQTFTATGLLSVNTREGGGDLQIEQETQARLLVHGGLFTRVLEKSEEIHKTEWYKQFANASAAKADLIKHFRVTVIPKSRLLEVRFSGPVAKDCDTILRAIVNEEINDQKLRITRTDIENNQALETLKLNYETEIRTRRGRMLRIATELGQEGVGIGRDANSKDFELQSLIKEELRATAVAGAAIAKRKTFDEQMQTNSAPELEEALQRSKIYMEFRRDVDQSELTYTDAVNRFGKEHETTVKAKQRLDAIKQKLADTENDIKSRTAELLRANLMNDQEAAGAALKRILQRTTEVRTAIATLSTQQNEYEQLNGELNNYIKLHNFVKEQQDKIGFLMNSGKRSPIDWAAQPDVSVGDE